jgi:cytochrome c biogenesis protein CcmG/thiol:disulfide interchange protein DsbE
MAVNVQDRPAAGGTPPPPGRRRTALISAAVVGVVLVLLVVVLATRKPASTDPHNSALVGQPAPVLEGSYVQGNRVEMGDGSHFVVVNFFAAWCTTCVQEHPQLKAFEAEHARTGDATLVSVVAGDTKANARDFFHANGGGWPVVYDADGRTAVAYGMIKVPETYVVDPAGTVIYKFSAGVTKDALDSLIAQAKRQGA